MSVQLEVVKDHQGRPRGVIVRPVVPEVVRDRTGQRRGIVEREQEQE